MNIRFKTFLSGIFISKKVKLLNNQLEKQAERIKILEVLNKNLQNVNLDKIEKLKIQELKKTIKNKDKLIESLQNQIAELKIKLYSKKTE